MRRRIEEEQEDAKSLRRQLDMSELARSGLIMELEAATTAAAAMSAGRQLDETGQGDDTKPPHSRLPPSTMRKTTGWLDVDQI